MITAWADPGAGEGDRDDYHGRDQRADLGDQVEQTDDQGEHDRKRSADDQGRDADHRAGDDRDRESAGAP